MTKIALACDHGGFTLKQAIIADLESKGIDFLDYGCYSEERAEYPVYAEKVAQAVSDGTIERGILCCGTGAGMAITANKFPGVRAVVCSEPFTASLSRKHNNSNVLCLGGRVLGAGLAVMIVEEWLNAEFEGGGRHTERLAMVAQIEQKLGLQK